VVEKGKPFSRSPDESGSSLRFDRTKGEGLKKMNQHRIHVFHRRGLFTPLALGGLLLLLVGLSCISVGGKPDSGKAAPVDTIQANTVLADSSYTIPEPGLLAPGSGGLKGYVSDRKTYDVIPGCIVRVNGVEKVRYDTTEVDGFYSVNNIPPGSYTIQVSNWWYKTVLIEDVPVQPGKITQVDFRLKLKPKKFNPTGWIEDP
jgi:hypothetical protein